jgi:hypothetical protein
MSCLVSGLRLKIVENASVAPWQYHYVTERTLHYSKLLDTLRITETPRSVNDGSGRIRVRDGRCTEVAMAGGFAMISAIM